MHCSEKESTEIIGQKDWFKLRNKDSTNNQNPNRKIQRNRTTTPDQRIEGVLFCPYTPGSKLKRELTKIEATMNGNRKTGKTRIVERAGPTLSQMLTNKAPWKKEWCGRTECLACQSKPGACRKLNVVYRITCVESQEIVQKDPLHRRVQQKFLG